MACPFSNVYNSCYCLIGYELPLLYEDLQSVDSYPVYVLNVAKNNIGVANSPSEYAQLWNLDILNRQYGKLYVGTGVFCFFLQRENELTPPSNVFGAEILPTPKYLTTEDDTGNKNILTEDNTGNQPIKIE